MTREDLIGLEFDWFVVDDFNNVAILSSAGYGFIPNKVIENYNKYEEINNQFNLSNIGTINVWDDYKAYGLFVYDWNIYDGPYTRKAIPCKKMPDDLKDKILSIENIIKISGNFNNIAVIKKEYLDKYNR